MRLERTAETLAEDARQCFKPYSEGQGHEWHSSDHSSESEADRLNSTCPLQMHPSLPGKRTLGQAASVECTNLLSRVIVGCLGPWAGASGEQCNMMARLSKVVREVFCSLSDMQKRQHQTPKQLTD